MFLSSRLFISPYYLKRIFYSFIGKTIGTDIRERRLTEAGTDIKKGEKVLEVAIKYGYESQESFTRAFKKFHKVNPGVAKKGNILSCLPRINVKNIIKGGINMDIKIETEKEFCIIVISKQFKEDKVSVYSLAYILFSNENTMAYEILKKTKVDTKFLSNLLMQKMQRKNTLTLYQSKMVLIIRY